mmetsp:Transcript_37756/g.87258  ORF Transcript_37756/g.87258 Transcript_37756/m.87258 type:complete len:260 (-) Transcript_37756:305-1084(-)
MASTGPRFQPCRTHCRIVLVKVVEGSNHRSSLLITPGGHPEEGRPTLPIERIGAKHGYLRQLRDITLLEGVGADLVHSSDDPNGMELVSVHVLHRDNQYTSRETVELLFFSTEVISIEVMTAKVKYSSELRCFTYAAHFPRYSSHVLVWHTHAPNFPSDLIDKEGVALLSSQHSAHLCNDRLQVLLQANHRGCQHLKEVNMRLEILQLRILCKPSRKLLHQPMPTVARAKALRALPTIPSSAFAVVGTLHGRTTAVAGF